MDPASGTEKEAVQAPAPENTLEFLGIGFQLHSATGWGVVGINLAVQLLKKKLTLPVPFVASGSISRDIQDRDILETALRSEKDFASRIAGREDNHVTMNFPAIHALGDSLFDATSGAFTGCPNLGWVALCNTHLPPAAIERAARFDRIFTASTWNAEILRAAGLGNVSVGLQGADPGLFSPGPPADRYPGRFVVFSGGKLEYRKGQDLVLEAFRRFRERHADAFLLLSWQNSWDFSVETFLRSPYVESLPRYGEKHVLRIAEWLTAGGLPEDSFESLPLLPNDQMIGHLRAADVALFPNRSEGGTNMVAMECLAAGLPVILSENTGHLDLTRTVDCRILHDQKPVPTIGPEDGTDGWGESNLDEILEALEWAYQNRGEAREMGLRASGQMKPWSWSERVGGFFNGVREVFKAAG